MVAGLQQLAASVFVQLAEVHFASQGDPAAPIPLKQMTKSDVAGAACDYAEALFAEFGNRVKREQEERQSNGGSGIIIDAHG
jgi:hypothetical protein